VEVAAFRHALEYLSMTLRGRDLLGRQEIFSEQYELMRS
jgi:hypothetical protein